jgi:hypothetical protein
MVSLGEYDAYLKRVPPLTDAMGRYPGQEHVAGNSKIPSIMYYDKHSKVMAAGAEADNASIISQAEDEDWIKTELYVCIPVYPLPCHF